MAMTRGSFFRAMAAAAILAGASPALAAEQTIDDVLGTPRTPGIPPAAPKESHPVPSEPMESHPNPSQPMPSQVRPLPPEVPKMPPRTTARSPVLTPRTPPAGLRPPVAPVAPQDDPLSLAVEESLRAQGAEGDLKVNVLKRPDPSAVFQGLESLTRDPRTRGFEGSVRLKLPDGSVQVQPIRGRYEEMVMVPVVKRRYTLGETIHAEDVEMMPYASLRLNGTTVRESARVSGMTARRSLTPYRPIREDDLQPQVVIAKDAIVTIVYQVTGMELRTTAQALEPGSLGRAIRLKNLQSGTIVYGTVESAELVRVTGNAPSVKGLKP